MKYEPKNSAIAAQLAAHHDLFGGWDESQALATAIEEHNSDAVDAVYFELPSRAQQIIDRMIAIAWKVPVSSLSIFEEC
jgi:hypothetical protein